MEIPLSEFKIIKELGKGAFGVVHLAERKAELFALKSLKLSGELPEGILTEIQHEVKIMLQLRHPNVVLVVAYSFNEPGRYVAMEYLEGGNLRELLSSKTPIATSTQQKFALDIARGMNYLHSLPKPVFHRDLKANNVLVDHSGTLKVSDFGLSTVSSYSATAATAMQPINWCAPELAKGEAFKAPCDVYSYAMTLYEILSRELPFQGKNAQEIFFALMQNKRPVIPIGAPTDLGTLMTECWHNEPNQRPTFEAIVQRLRATTSKQDSIFSASSSLQPTSSNDEIKQLELELKIKSQKESEIQTKAQAQIRLEQERSKQLQEAQKRAQEAEDRARQMEMEAQRLKQQEETQRHIQDERERAKQMEAERQRLQRIQEEQERKSAAETQNRKQEEERARQLEAAEKSKKEEEEEERAKPSKV